MLQCRARGAEHREDVHLEGLLELIVGQVVQSLDRDLLAGIVDQDVQPAELFDRLVHDLGAERGIRQVAGESNCLATALADDARDVLGIGLFVRQVRDRDVGTLPRERDCSSSADARVTTGDQCLTSFEPARASIRELADVGLGHHVGVESRLGLILLRR